MISLTLVMWIMARNKAGNYDSKRDSITQKAAVLFAAKGFSGASISDISRACNISKSLIYHYYSAKEGILYDVMNNHIDDLIIAISGNDLINPDPKQEFHNLTLALLKCYAGAEDAQKVLLYELDNLPPDQRKVIVTKQRQIIDRFEKVYIRLDPKIKKNAPQLRSKIMLFFGSVNWIHTWYSPKGEVSRDKLAQMAAENAIGNG